jgi:hypothetical protein
MTVQTNLCDHPEPIDPPTEDVETREVMLALMEGSGFPATVAETDAKLSELVTKRYRETLLARRGDITDLIERLIDHRRGLSA